MILWEALWWASAALIAVALVLGTWRNREAKWISEGVWAIAMGCLAGAAYADPQAEGASRWVPFILAAGLMVGAIFKMVVDAHDVENCDVCKRAGIGPHAHRKEQADAECEVDEGQVHGVSPEEAGDRPEQR